MRGKRAKAYRKLMHQYHVNFNFREPYQVLLDSAILQDAARYKIDLIGRLAKMLDGEVKPMITTCDMRHLYGAEPKDERLILQAKGYERRRCNHQDLDEPLSSLECLSDVVDPKSSLTNKHRYVVASQDPRVRAHMRKIAGVPLIYISKSVVILEPMGTATEKLREREEKAKFKAGLKGRRSANVPNVGQKRKRDEDDDTTHDQGGGSIAEQSTGNARPRKIRKGPKAPNPLSMKKAKKAPQDEPKKARRTEDEASHIPPADSEPSNPGGEPAKRKRKRKHKPKADGGGTEAQTEGDAASP
ncbi:hypothetical protein P154DRAFT_490526 [Amniculicola lignicola CBS 123094]|uniref:U three protein 23 n=1 Tax=Amniculicola lignicola CBS 123094 TaxID=1392246 RepID=A0A6A5WLY6_9PLEO|nr:hypothetical protein P154DRAFT_490526 [Amniculicola lignicola CBS 123094]